MKEEKESKRERILGQKKRFSLWKIVLIVSVAAALPATWALLREEAPQASPVKASGTQVMEKVSYANQNVPMSPVKAVVEHGSIEIPLDAVKNSKIVSFDYEKNNTSIPLLAYITPSGKLVTTVRLCEPCNSKSFHIEVNQMVCNACFTRWDLETLKGISGGCLAYPPDALPHTVANGKVTIKNVDLQNWKPRVVRG